MSPRAWLIISLALMAASRMREAFANNIGAGFVTQTIFPGLWLLALPALLMAVRGYRLNHPYAPSSPGFTWRWILLALIVVLIAAYGALMNGLDRYFISDAWVYVMLLLFLSLGRYDQAWKDMEKPLAALFIIGLLIVVPSTQQAHRVVETVDAVGAITITGATAADLAGARGAVASVGYRIQEAIWMWPLVFALAVVRPRMDKWKVIGIAAAVAMLALEVYFQKRAPFVRTLAYITMAVLVVPMLRRRLQFGTFALSVVVLLGAAVFLVGSDSFNRLLGRFEEARDFTQTSRFYEAQAMLRDLGGLELITGRGLGGWWNTPYDWRAGSVTIGTDRRSYALHVGALVPVLKGGALLAVGLLAIFVPVFLPKRAGFYDDPFNVAAMTVLPVLLLSLSIEGFASTANPFHTLLLGLCAARVVALPIPDRETQQMLAYQTVEQEPTMAGV